ncbi:MAG: hypothetical protein IKS60_04890 [Lachnospiraceae bacterium]|nr:hypothetical protein [Lachnospiraceae bacterium]MBR5066426.1 hypothetical protein [Lachnospiraceae bacterium]MBR5917606.1 hypothetical protein [Lachnospiraceae bacterium]
MGCAVFGLLVIAIVWVALIIGAIKLFAMAKDVECVNKLMAHVYRGCGIACIIIALIPVAFIIYMFVGGYFSFMSSIKQ